MNPEPLFHLRQRITWNAVTRWTVHTLLMAGIGLSLWQLVGTLRAKPTNMSAVKTLTITSRSPSDHIAAVHLFGSSAPAPTMAVIAADDVKLAGVLVADPPGNSMAIIDLQGEEKVLSVGASLPDGETLKAITPQGITLARASEERQLTLQLSQAPIDAMFATLPVNVAGEAGSQTVSNTPIVATAPAIPMTQQLTLLRQAAVLTLADRARHRPPP